MKELDGVLLKRMILSGANNLYNCYPEIDALNVFPVPDGDTGTNMNLTMASGAKEVFDSKNVEIGSVAKAFARGLLTGARGNSGVILSQIFMGFSEALNDKTKINAIEFANAFNMGKEAAYKAVIRPVEGTILTIIKEASDALLQKVEMNMHIDKCMDIVYEEAQNSLNRTPELLPILKEVGVVDSGGAGLCKIFEGFSRALHNDIVEKDIATSVDYTAPINVKPSVSIQSKFEHDEFGYCTQFMLVTSKNNDKKVFNEKRFKSVLSAHGNSIVMAVIDDLVKVHIHTLNPGIILTYAQQFGEFKMIKIDNMSEQHEEILLNDLKAGNIDNQKKLDAPLSADKTISSEETNKKLHSTKELKELALIAVGVGSGIVDLFKKSNVDYIVSGGQTMNPSSGDFISAIKEVNAKNVIILPNNSNIIMAAKQASEIVKDSYNVKVIETKSISSGLIASALYNPSGTIEENIENINSNLEFIKTGEVTYAIKDTSIDGVEVKKGYFMGIEGKKITCCDKDKFKVLVNLVKELYVEDESQVVTVICGEDIDEKGKERVSKLFEKEFEGKIDLELLDGNQPLFSFYVAVE